MSENRLSYNSVAKSTVLFGGIKFVEIIVNVIRTKIVALLLGPEGMGIQTLFVSALTSISQFSSLGIFQSSVRDISLAYESGNKSQIRRIVKIVDRWVWIVAAIGVVLCIVGSKWLSLFVFNNPEYSWQFIMLSLAILFWSLSNGNITIMQGCRQLIPLAKSSLIGAVISLLATIPLYFWLGITGIVPALIIGYLSAYLINLCFVNKFKKIHINKISTSEIVNEGKAIIKLGVILMFSNLLMTFLGLLTNSYIADIGGVKDVGFFQASFSITFGNLTVILAVLASDFYPKLSAIYKDDLKISQLVNQQIELLLLFITPMSVFLIIFSPIVVELLYSSDFYSIIPMLRLMSIALIFRIIWHSLSYVILSKGDRRTFFIYDAFIGNGLNFIFNIISYFFWGLSGLAVSFVIGAISMSMILYTVVHVKYNFKFEKELVLLFVEFLILVIFCFCSIYLIDGFCRYFVNFIIVLLLLIIITKRINDRFDLKKYIYNAFARK